VGKKDIVQFLFIPPGKPDGACLKVVGAVKPDGYARINNRIKLLKDVTLKPGDEIILKAKIKCIKLSGKFQVMFRQADAKGKSLNYTGTTLRRRYKCNWKEFSRKIKIVKKSDRFYIYIISTYLSKEDAVYVKDISIEKVASKSSDN
jgi:hypothetical protein